MEGQDAPLPLTRAVSYTAPVDVTELPAAPTLQRAKSSLARSGTGQLTPAQRPLSRQSSSTIPPQHVLIRTSSGMEVALPSPSEFRELQCACCGELVENPVHGPCGHSFCRRHLEDADKKEVEEEPVAEPQGEFDMPGLSGHWQELELQAWLLRVLIRKYHWPFSRAREALAVIQPGGRTPPSPDIVERAIASVDANSLEGHAVRVRPDVKEPRFQWGSVSPGSVGVVIQQDNGHAYVDFPEQNRWHCLVEELEVEPISDAIREGSVVKLRATGKSPARGWGFLEGDMIGVVANRQSVVCQIITADGVWSGFVGELEVVPGLHGLGHVPQALDLEKALARLEAGRPAAATLQVLIATLQQAAAEAEKGLAPRLPLRTHRRDVLVHSHGSVDVLRAVGLDMTLWNRSRLLMLVEAAARTPEELNLPQMAALAREAIAGASALKQKLYSSRPPLKEVNDEGAKVKRGTEETKKWFCGRELGVRAIPGSDGRCGPSNGPQCPSCRRYQEQEQLEEDDDDTYSVFILSKPPLESLKDISGLRGMVVPAIAPPDQHWTWRQRGWGEEAELLEQLKRLLAGKTPVEVARWQEQDEAKAVATRLIEKGFDAEVKKVPLLPPPVHLSRSFKAEAHEREAAQTLQHEVFLGHPTTEEIAASDFPIGSRVVVKPDWISRLPLPSNHDKDLVGIVSGQLFSYGDLHVGTIPDGEEATTDTGAEQGPRLYLCAQFPKMQRLPPLPVQALEHWTASQGVQGGTKVKVRAGKTPTFGWGTVHSSDVGVVHEVGPDGVVHVFFPDAQRLWLAALQDLDSKDLPRPKACPVCSRPFPSGQIVAVDLAMDSQIRRLRGLMEGQLHESNTLGTRAPPQETVAALVRTETHQAELMCIFCHDLLVAPVTLPCGHSFCKMHIEVWLLQNDTCPTCKSRVHKRPQGRRRIQAAAPGVATLFGSRFPEEELPQAQIAAQLQLSGAEAENDTELGLRVNEMLQSQLVRFFPKELQSRVTEVAAETWTQLQGRMPGFLRRLRSFLQQHRTIGAIELLRLASEAAAEEKRKQEALQARAAEWPWLASGKWLGYYTQSHNRQDLPEYTLEVDSEGNLTGTGSDPVGNYSLRGFVAKDGKVTFDKTYASHTVKYEGTLHEDGHGSGIKGRWSIRDVNNPSEEVYGDFHLYPAPGTAEVRLEAKAPSQDAVARFAPPPRVELKPEEELKDLVLPCARGGTLLMLVVEQGLTDVVRALVQRRADPLANAPPVSLGLDTDHGAGGISTLSLAAGKGHVDTLKVLLEAAEDVDEEDVRIRELRANALGAALEGKQPECAELLVASGGTELLEQRNCLGFTALLTAVQAGSEQGVELLLKHKADLEARTAQAGLLVFGATRSKANGAYREAGKFGDRPLYINDQGAVIYCSFWWKLAESREVAEKDTPGQETNGGVWWYSAPAPHRALPEPPTGKWTLDGTRPLPQVQQAPEVQRLAEAGRATTPLLLAAQLGLAPLMQLLLNAGAEYKARIPCSGRTALHVAAAVGDMGVLKVLLGRGAAGDEERLLLTERDALGLTALQVACRAGHGLLVRELLAASANPFVEEGTPIENSALVLAASCGRSHIAGASEGDEEPTARQEAYKEVVAALLGAMLQRTPDEKTLPPGSIEAFHAAAIVGSALVIEELLNALGPRGLDVDVPDKEGTTPLLRALTSEEGDENITKTANVLLERKADPNAKRARDGLTVLMAAAAHGNGDLIQRLLDASVDPNTQLGPAASGEMPVLVVAKVGVPGFAVVDDLARSGVPLLAPGGPSCKNGHPLERMRAVDCIRRPACDGCHKKGLHQSEAFFWTCWMCDYDLCAHCGGVPAAVILETSPASLSENQAEELAEIHKKVNTALEEKLVERFQMGGWTALHCAAACGRLEAGKRLIQSGANVLTEDVQGLTPLHWSVLVDCSALAEVILEADATTAAAKDKQGRLALDLAQIEMLRSAYKALAAEEANLPHAQEMTFAPVVELEVNLGELLPARGTYSAIQPTRPQPPPGEEPQEPQEPLRLFYDRDGRGFAIRALAEARFHQSQHGSHAAHRAEARGPGWGIFRGDNVLAQTAVDTERCPLTGWAPPSGTSEGVSLMVREALPWRLGRRLLQSTPAELRSADIKKAVEALPEEVPVSHHVVGPDGLTFTVVGPADAPPPPLEALLAEMQRRGTLPPLGLPGLPGLGLPGLPLLPLPLGTGPAPGAAPAPQAARPPGGAGQPPECQVQ